MLAPITLFTYNRLWETRQTVEALKNNFLASESELFVFSDGPKNIEASLKVNEVREYLKTISGFRKVNIIESENNKGLAESIISGVSQVLTKYDNVIVLEDDLITNPRFLNFMNDALNFYENEKRIQSVNGFSLFIKELNTDSDIYFHKRPFSWGWATWSDRWDTDIFNKQNLRKEIENNPQILKQFKKECGDDIVRMLTGSVNNKNDSWYVRWAYNHFKNNNYSLYPKYSLVENIGFGENGTHCKTINPYFYKLESDNKTNFVFDEFKKPDSKTTKTFLNNFSIKHKIALRLRLLKSRSGRAQLKSEIMQKLNIQ